MPYLFVVRTVLVRRENGTYSGGQGKDLVAGVGVEVGPSGSASLSGCPPAASGLGVAVTGREAVAAAGGVLSGAGEAVLHIHPGPRRDCWRHSNVFPPREAEVSRMNVQRGRRCTFILVPRPRPMGGSA